MSVPQQLAALGIPEHCIKRRSSAQERGRRFSIRPRRGEDIWCVHVDGCWLEDNNQKRVDYVFWCQDAAGRWSVVLVELKGKDFGRALGQIEATLQVLCKQSEGNIIHPASDCPLLKHDPPGVGGVRAFVILSKGKGVPLRTAARQRLQQRYGVIVSPFSQELWIDGLSALAVSGR